MILLYPQIYLTEWQINPLLFFLLFGFILCFFWGNIKMSLSKSLTVYFFFVQLGDKLHVLKDGRKLNFINNFLINKG